MVSILCYKHPACVLTKRGSFNLFSVQQITDFDRFFKAFYHNFPHNVMDVHEFDFF